MSPGKSVGLESGDGPYPIHDVELIRVGGLRAMPNAGQLVRVGNLASGSPKQG
jgi:hypothetical protein